MTVFVNKTSCFHPTDFCHLPSDQGEGTSFTFFVYYDPKADSCSPFFYKGQGGNRNRFQSERDCMRNCSLNSEGTYPMDGKKIKLCIQAENVKKT